MMWIEGVLMTQPHQRYRHPRYKKKYKVTNWSSYDRSLVNRGDITLWLSEEVLQSWNDCPEQAFGRPRLYSDLAIETALSLRLIFKLPLRQTEGLLRSLFKLMNLDLSVPDHTTLSRRNQTLNIKLKRMGSVTGPIDLVIDSTGLAIHGEGRWTRHKHGKRKRRGWRKLHIGVSDGLIVASHLTDERVPDGSIAPNLIKQAGSINALTADKAYDQIDVYQAAIDRGSTDLKLLIHPRTDAVISASNQAALRQRDVHVKSIKEDGVFAWRRTSGYYDQSAVEKYVL